MYTCVGIIRWALNSYAEGLSYDKVACDECLWTDSGASEGDSYRNSGCVPASFSIQHPDTGPREVSRARAVQRLHSGHREDARGAFVDLGAPYGMVCVQ